MKAANNFPSGGLPGGLRLIGMNAIPLDFLPPNRQGSVGLINAWRSKSMPLSHERATVSRSNGP